jgi:hypothetical protein
MLGYGIPEEGHRAGIGVRQPKQNPDERGLTGAVRPEVAKCASPRDAQFYAVYGDGLPESLGQPVGLHGPGVLGSLPVGSLREDRGAHRSRCKIRSGQLKGTG